MQRTYSSDVALLLTITPAHTHTFVTSWRAFKNSVAVENGLLKPQPLKNSFTDTNGTNLSPSSSAPNITTHVTRLN